MPNGTATIVGILPCRNGRRANTAKARVYAYDADVFLAVDKDGTHQTALAYLYYFLPVGSDTPPPSNEPYYISGKIVSIELANGAADSDYDLMIEAQVMHPVRDMIPIQPTVVIGGTVAEVSGHLRFEINIDQWVSVLGASHNASFDVSSQRGNLRFENHRIGSGSRCVLTGVITGESSRKATKRIPFEFYDYNFISILPPETPVRGKTNNYYNSPKIPRLLLLSPPGTPTMSEKSS